MNYHYGLSSTYSRIIFTTFLISIILGCSEAESHLLQQAQVIAMEDEMDKAFEKIKEDVYNTGANLRSLTCLEYAEEFKEYYNQIRNEHKVSQITEQTNSLMELSPEGIDKSSLPTDLLHKSLAEINGSHLTKHRMSVLIYVQSAIRLLHAYHSETFFDFDIVSPIVISQKDTYPSGQNVEFEIGIEARNSALKPEVLVRVSGTQEFFPIDVSSRSGRATFKVGNLPPGTHSVDVKMTYPKNGRVVEMETTYEFEVVN